MGETMNIKRTTPYGVQLEDGSYRNTSEEVKKFLENQLPCSVEVQQVDDNNKIQRVKVLNSEPKPANGNSKLSEAKNDANMRMSALSNATQVATAVTKDKDSAQIQKEIETLREENLKWLRGEK